MRDLKLMNKMREAATKLLENAYDVQFALEEAEFASRMASFNREADHVGYVQDAGTQTETARKELARFDKHLMELIQLRGKLAEVTGTPMGGKQWVRLDQYEM